MGKMSGRRTGMALGALSFFLGLPAAAQSPAPVSDVPPAIQQLRWSMLDANVNSLTFRSMDTLFTTRVVGRSGAVWNLPRADRALDVRYIFEGKTYDAADVLERTFTNALLVIKNGRIVSELYRNNSNDKTRFMSWSMAKSFTSTLLGIALAEGKIKSLDDRITLYLPELRGSGYDGATIRHVLHMRSGVEYEERYDFANPSPASENHKNALVLNVARFADAARTVKSIHKPGEVFAYKTLDTAVLGWLVERVAGTTFSAYMSQKLWEPLGAERDGFFVMDGPPGIGREFTGAGYNATLRDYARFGLLMLGKGEVNGHRILSAAWVAEATAPAAPEGERGGYGYQWWTVPDSDAYYALGLQGQYIYVDPATSTVVVKLSYFPPGDAKAGAETLAFLNAVSRWQPGAP